MERLINTLKDKWPEFTWEIIVITLGILGALALDNWNDQRKEDTFKQVTLESFKEELIDNINFLEQRIDWNTTMQSRIDKVLTEKPNEMTDIQLVEFYASVAGFPPSVPATPILDDLLQAEAFKNELELLNKLRVLKHVISDLKTAENFINELFINEISPFSNKNGLTLTLYKSVKNTSFELTDKQRALVMDTHYLNLAATKSLNQDDWIGSQKASKESMQDILDSFTSP